jgi:leucyl aminopeptidase
MKFLALVALSAATSAFASLPAQQAPLLNEEQYLIELGPGETRWIAEDEKWELKRVCCFPSFYRSRAAYKLPCC